jgi:ABC-type branched-subunit amino acid transport system permease subunit
LPYEKTLLIRLFLSKTAPDVFFGAVLIAVMILLPSGIAGLARRLPILRRSRRAG